MKATHTLKSLRTVILTPLR
jgi:hypothetical protein